MQLSNQIIFFAVRGLSYVVLVILKAVNFIWQEIAPALKFSGYLFWFLGFLSLPLAGLGLGWLLASVNNLWDKSSAMLNVPLAALTISDLFILVAPYVIFLGCGWFGLQCSLAINRKIENWFP